MGREMIVQLVPQLPDYTTFYYCRLGAFSLSTNAVRYIAYEDVVTYEEKQDTSGAHYRNFLQSRQVAFPRRNAPVLDISYPYYAKATALPSAIYLDLRRAYQQIALSIGLEVWYREGKSFGFGSTTPNTELFETDKISRGLLVTGHYRTSSYTLWNNGNLSNVHFTNVHYAPYLQYAIWRILHAIMSKLKPFIFYAHTDGVIINSRFIGRAEKILDRYHFRYAIKDVGNARIKTTGTYQIGDRKTFNFERNLPKSTDYILSDDRDDWWLKMFARGVELRGLMPSS